MGASGVGAGIFMYCGKTSKRRETTEQNDECDVLCVKSHVIVILTSVTRTSNASGVFISQFYLYQM